MTTMSTLLVLSFSQLLTLCYGYYLGLHGLEWYNASNWCQIYCGSHLASVHSLSDHLEMLDLIDRKSDYIYTRTWIGLSDIAKSDVWVWSDGTPFDYGNEIDPDYGNLNYVKKGVFPWRSNEPDYNKSSDQCVAIEVGSNYDGNSAQWVDRRLTANYQFFCNECSGKLHKYAAINGDRNISEARSICESRFGTSLASIHSDDDMMEARITCKEITGSNGCWIGLYDPTEGSHQFVWDDGTEWDYGTTLNQWPWYASEPGATNNQHCIFFDPDNGADPGEYLWDDFWCSTQSPKALCNAPSEICLDQQWFVPTGNPNDWVFSKMPCELTKNVMELESSAIIGDKQYVNANGLLLVDMMYTISSTGTNGNAGIIFHFDSSCDNFFYIGIWADYNMVFIGKEVNGVWTTLNYASMSSSGITYKKGTYYNLGIELSGGTEWKVKVNDIEMLTLSDQDNAGNIYSGYVGIREVNATFTAKSLFISGEVEYFDGNSWYLQCTNAPTLSPTMPTLAPSVSPSENPSLSPSQDPSSAPSNPPSQSPTDVTASPTDDTLPPTNQPSVPTLQPSLDPTTEPTPDTSEPTVHPTSDPTSKPSVDPTAKPTEDPTAKPTEVPSSFPSVNPTINPTTHPITTNTPTNIPTFDPTVLPSNNPSILPSFEPTILPSPQPTDFPTIQPSEVPSASPTKEPTSHPSTEPTWGHPTEDPTVRPTNDLTNNPTNDPTEGGAITNPDTSRNNGIGDQIQPSAATTGNTQMIWIIGIPIGLVLMCAFCGFLLKTWREESPKKERRKSSHIKSPSNSPQNTDDEDDDDVIDDMDEVEMGTTATGGIIDNDDVELEIDDGDDDIADDDPALPLNTNDDVVPDSPGMTGEEKEKDEVQNDDNDENDVELEEVTMVPSGDGDGALIPVKNKKNTDDLLDGEDAIDEASPTPALTTPLKNGGEFKD